MRSVAAVAALCGLLLNTGFAQVKSTASLQPTKFEAFATQPTALVTWSKEVGQIESPKARVTVTALIIEVREPVPQQMCGIRIDLATHNASDQVYLEEAHLETIKAALEQIDSEIASFRNEPDPAPNRYRGAAEFWHPQLRVHTLNAAYYIVPGSSGLSLSAYKQQEFRFPDHRPLELAKVMGQGIDELKQHCAK